MPVKAGGRLQAAATFTVIADMVPGAAGDSAVGSITRL